DLRDLARSLLDARHDGRVKLYLSYRALHCRRDHPGLFSAGEYLPLEITGDRAKHLFAFARRSGEQWAVVAVPRLLTRLVPDGRQPPLGEVWQDTRVILPPIEPGLRWRNAFTGEVLSAAEHEGRLSLAATELTGPRR